MTDKHPPMPVHGFTEQSAEAIELVNKNKEIEETLLRVIDSFEKDKDTFDPRSVALARTYLQTGFMWLNRAVFKPQRIKLSSDGSGAD